MSLRDKCLDRILGFSPGSNPNEALDKSELPRVVVLEKSEITLRSGRHAELADHFGDGEPLLVSALGCPHAGEKASGCSQKKKILAQQSHCS